MKRGVRAAAVALFLAGVAATAQADLLSDILERGYAYGREHDLRECFDETFAHFLACQDFQCRALVQGFGRGCARTATYSAEFCSMLPPTPLDLLAWINFQCEAYGHAGSKACTKALQSPTTACFDRFGH